MSVRSIRMAMMLLVGGVVFAVQSALIVVVARYSYEASLTSSVDQMRLLAGTIAKSLGDFGEQQQMVLHGAVLQPALKEYLRNRHARPAPDHHQARVSGCLPRFLRKQNQLGRVAAADTRQGCRSGARGSYGAVFGGYGYLFSQAARQSGLHDLILLSKTLTCDPVTRQQCLPVASFPGACPETDHVKPARL